MNVSRWTAIGVGRSGEVTQGATMRTAVIRPLQRPVPLRQSVYDALIDLIVSGDLPPGQHMVETDLARQLGVSRQPIREALHRMEAEGWVDLRPSQGAFVHVPTDSEVDELLDKFQSTCELGPDWTTSRFGGPLPSTWGARWMDPLRA